MVAVAAAGLLAGAFADHRSDLRAERPRTRVAARRTVAALVCAAACVSVFAARGATLASLQYVLLMIVACAASLYDLKARIVPNAFVASAVAVRLLFCLLSPSRLFSLLWSVLGGAVVLAPVLLVVLVMDRRTGRSNMGGGDLKLFFAVGMYVPWQQGLLLLVAACLFGVLGALVSGRGRVSAAQTVPFAPSIALATWLTVLVGGPVLAWYTGLFL